MTRCIAIGGMIATGKSTLARALAAQTYRRRVPSVRLATPYLTDLFENPIRWAAEAQLAFVIEKAAQLIDESSAGAGIVLERTLEEDERIFFSYFRQHGFITPRSEVVYNKLLRLVPSYARNPELTIVCIGSWEVVRARIASRIDAPPYSEHYLEWVFNRYDEWMRGLRRPGIYFLASHHIDWRIPSVVDEIIQEVNGVTSGQMSSLRFLRPAM